MHELSSGIFLFRLFEYVRRALKTQSIKASFSWKILLFSNNICGFEMSVTFIEIACNFKLCLLVQGTSIWVLLIMSGIRDVITGQLDVTPETG